VPFIVEVTPLRSRKNCVRTSSFKLTANYKRTAYCYKNLWPAVSIGDLIKIAQFELSSESSALSLNEPDEMPPDSMIDVLVEEGQTLVLTNNNA
jgi:hypothetical protein